MQIGQRSCDGEAKARAVIGLGELALDLLERPAEPHQRLRRNSDAGVGDHQDDRILPPPAANDHPAVVGRELDGVGQQIDDDLLDRPAVGDDRYRAFDVGFEREVLVVGAPGHHAQRFRQRLRQVERLHVELHAAGLDLRHVQDVVDHFEQIVAAGENVVAVFLVFLRPERSEHAAFHDLGKSDDGVERGAQFVAHIGEEFGFGLVGFLGAVFLLGIFFGEIGKFDGLPFELGLRALQVDHGGAQAKVVVDQFLFVLLDAGDVGSDRDVAAVLGAALADMQPAAVVELRLEGARARRRAPASCSRVRTSGMLPTSITVS